MPKQLIQICFYFLQYATAAKIFCHLFHITCAVSCFVTLSAHANFSLCSLVCICCAVLCFAIFSTNTALCVVILSVYATVMLCHLVCMLCCIFTWSSCTHVLFLCFHLVYICHHFFIAVSLLQYHSHFLCLLHSVCVFFFQTNNYKC